MFYSNFSLVPEILHQGKAQALTIPLYHTYDSNHKMQLGLHSVGQQLTVLIENSKTRQMWQK
jgi:hypothetical protein